MEHPYRADEKEAEFRRDQEEYRRKGLDLIKVQGMRCLTRNPDKNIQKKSTTEKVWSVLTNLF